MPHTGFPPGPSGLQLTPASRYLPRCVLKVRLSVISPAPHADGCPPFLGGSTETGAGACEYDAPPSVEVASVTAFSQQARSDRHSGECSQPWYSLWTSACTVRPSSVWVAAIHSRLS